MKFQCSSLSILLTVSALQICCAVSSGGNGMSSKILRSWEISSERDLQVRGGGNTLAVPSATAATTDTASLTQQAPNRLPPPPPPPPQRSHNTRVKAFEPPKVSLKQISLALRLTSEWNRRLLQGVSANLAKYGAAVGHDPSQHQQHHDHQQQQQYNNHQQQPSYLQQRGGSHPVNVHPSRPWSPPISAGDPDPGVELTLFHAKTPRDHSTHRSGTRKVRRGAARWGPELLPYLKFIAARLDIGDGDNGIEVPLAMIYLDRACSVETHRSDGVPSLPFCTPRTVHRLSLVAMIVASQAVHGGRFEDYFQKVQSLGIPIHQLRQMTEWFCRALGDEQLIVTVQQMKKWCQSWNYAFDPKEEEQHPSEQNSIVEKLATQQQQQQQQPAVPPPPAQPWGVPKATRNNAYQQGNK